MENCSFQTEADAFAPLDKAYQDILKDNFVVIITIGLTNRSHSVISQARIQTHCLSLQS